MIHPNQERLREEIVPLTQGGDSRGERRVLQITGVSMSAMNQCWLHGKKRQ